MVAYKLSKKYWVMHFFAIFRFIREQLLVTVALDHPVLDKKCCTLTDTQPQTYLVDV